MNISIEFNEKTLTKDIKLEAKALDIPIGAAESFIELAVPAVRKNLENKKIITKNDLQRALVKELKKYSTDLAYVYKNRDKII